MVDWQTRDGSANNICQQLRIKSTLEATRELAALVISSSVTVYKN